MMFSKLTEIGKGYSAICLLDFNVYVFKIFVNTVADELFQCVVRVSGKKKYVFELFFEYILNGRSFRNFLKNFSLFNCKTLNQVGKGVKTWDLILPISVFSKITIYNSNLRSKIK